MFTKRFWWMIGLLVYTLPSFAQKYGLGTDLVLEEGAPHPEWLLNSGGYFYVKDGIGRTVFGKLSEGDKWRQAHSVRNGRDTEQGFQPQNIFRLYTKKKFRNLEQQVYFRIKKLNLTDSPERDAWSGFQFFNRAEDSNNIYYTAIRMDGNVVIKKKIGSIYHTLSTKKVYVGTHHRKEKPNLIPENTWVGFRSKVTTLPNSKHVRIEVMMDTEGNGKWKSITVALDDGSEWGSTFLLPGFVGIRTDFMDVEFRDYWIKEL